MIKVNHLAWSPEDREELIESALEEYMSSRRKLRLTSTKFSMLDIPKDKSLDLGKVNVVEDDNFPSDDESEESDDDDEPLSDSEVDELFWKLQEGGSDDDTDF